MRRLLHLDGLRGWAAFFVILHHLELAFFPTIKGPNDGVSPVLGPFSFLADGPLAVAIFFLLSGIVLAEAVHAASHPDGPQQVGLTGLIIKRWLRLGLPIVVTGLLFLILFTLLGNRTTEASAVASSDWMQSLFPPGYHPDFFKVLHESVIGAFLGPQTPTHDPVLWTIRVEFLGSILVFMLCLFVPTGYARLGASALSAVILIAVPAWLPNFCALFAVGVVLRELANHFQERLAAFPLVNDVSGMAMILTAALLYPVLNLLVPDLMNDLGNAVDPLGHMSQWTARSLLIVAGTLLSPTAQALFRLPVSLFLGRISFGLYLMHLPILLSVGINSYLAAEPQMGHELAAITASLLVVACSLVTALAFHHVIERPAIRLASRAGSLTSGTGSGAAAKSR